ncbi:MAG: hypothetical protein PHH84_00570 [Oscillospiraceae bacterium]|nr:hypothetical protein [Oscillospiraceae bacterium]MDD4413037.1 hypothetical protein [Oscillospiraceae bacterium]
MLNFEPKSLNEIKEQIFEDIPSPNVFAADEDGEANRIIEDIRSGRLSFVELTAAEMDYVYQLANLCTQEEYERLLNIFPHRVTSKLFEIGWVYCQYNPNNNRAIELFTIVCKWMKKNRRSGFNNTLIGRTDLPWREIYVRAVEILRIKRISVERFCEKFDIIPNTQFYEQLNLINLSRCDKDELLENEEMLAGLIEKSELEYLRPALKNYTAHFDFEVMPQQIKDAISNRLSEESVDESIGLSPNMLKRICKQSLQSMLDQYGDKNASKKDVFNTIALRIRNIKPLKMGFYSIDFGGYVVIDNADWEDAYAYTPSVFRKLYKEWKAADYPENYWPAAEKSTLAEAKDIVFGIKKADVIRLGFTQFDILYTKDLLAVSRY